VAGIGFDHPFLALQCCFSNGQLLCDLDLEDECPSSVFAKNVCLERIHKQGYELSYLMQERITMEFVHPPDTLHDEQYQSPALL
jgi:hypothetical protein